MPLLSDELWSSITLQGRPPKFFNKLIGKETRKKIVLKGEIGYRSADSFFAGRQIYFDAGIGYKLSKTFTLGVEQRYSYRPNGQNRTRTIFQLGTEVEAGRFQFDHRFRYQHNYREFGSQRELLRNRFAVEYNFPKWKLDPYFSTEFFTWAHPQGLSYVGTRYRFGTQLNLGKAHSIDLSIIHDRERDIAWPQHRWIYSIDYGFNLTKVDRKKKSDPAVPVETAP